MNFNGISRTTSKYEIISKWFFQVLLCCASPFLVSRNSCRADNIYAPLASRTVGKFLESFELILTAPRGLLDKRNPTVGSACADWSTHATLPRCCWTVLAGAWDRAFLIGRNRDIMCAWRVECIINDYHNKNVACHKCASLRWYVEHGNVRYRMCTGLLSSTSWNLRPE
jgi:hypothetical protein